MPITIYYGVIQRRHLVTYRIILGPDCKHILLLCDICRLRRKWTVAWDHWILWCSNCLPDIWHRHPGIWYSNRQCHGDVIKWKHFPRYGPFVRGIHRSSVNSSHKGQWRGALMFSLTCIWINDWVNNHQAGDLRRYCIHYDVIVMVAHLSSAYRKDAPMLLHTTITFPYTSVLLQQ